MPTHISWAAAGYLDIPSVCTGLTANNSLFICDPSATGLAGTFIGYADFNVISYWNNSDGGVKSVAQSVCPSQSNLEPCDNTLMWDWFAEVAKAGGVVTQPHPLTTSKEDQVTIAKDANFVSFTNTIKESLLWQSFPLKILLPVELATIILFLISFQKRFGLMVMLDMIIVWV